MGKHRKQKLKRPSDNLSPRKLQEAWSNYLDVEVGRQGARPRWEVLIDPKIMDAVMFKALVKLERTTRTSRSEVYVKACNNVINKLPFMQRKSLKYYFGIGVKDPITQEEIAKELGISQKSVATGIERSMKNLRLLIRKELAKVVRDELRKDEAMPQLESY